MTVDILVVDMVIKAYRMLKKSRCKLAVSFERRSLAAPSPCVNVTGHVEKNEAVYWGEIASINEYRDITFV
jgi:hypothetical protein